MMRLSRKGLLASALVLVLVILFFAFFVDWRTSVAQLRQADRALLALAIIFLFVGYLIYAIRWHLLLGKQARYLAVWHTSNIGNLFNTLLPARPGDAARIFILSNKQDLPVLTVTSSIVVERWLEQIMRLAALGGAFLYGAGVPVSDITILGSVLFLIGMMLFMLWMIRRRELVLGRFPPLLARLPRVTEEGARQQLSNLIDGLATMSTAHRLLGALLWSVLSWAFFWGFHFLCLEALHPSLSLETTLAISLGSLALVPPSASTLPGVYQLSMVVPLALMGFDKTLLTSYSLLMNVVEMIMILALGMWGIMWSGISLAESSWAKR